MTRSMRNAGAVLALVASASFAHAQVAAEPIQGGAPARKPGPGIAAPGMYMGPSVSTRVIQSGTVVSGKVTKVDATGIEVSPYPGSPKMTYKVATIKVEEVLAGERKMTEVKVALDPAQPTGVMPGPVQLANYYPIQLIVGQEGTFFLKASPLVEGHYSAQAGFTPLNPDDTNYKADSAEVKKLTAVIGDLPKALKSDKKEDRYLAAAALVYQYRVFNNNTGVAPEQVAIPADESKLILKALLDADWTTKQGADQMLAPTNLLSLLGLYSGQNGFPQVNFRPGADYMAVMGEAYKSWHEQNGEKFEIKKFVAKAKK